MIKRIAQIVEDACKKETNHYGYGIWQYHVVYVVKYAKAMAKKIKADEEIVEIAALLHDYASISDFKLSEEHHLHGADLAEKLLLSFDYPRAKIDAVKECIFSHRGSRPMPKMSKEAICVADADGMSHFDSIGSLYNLALNKNKMSVEDANQWLIKKLERSWKKLSPEAKVMISNKYQACKLLIHN